LAKVKIFSEKRKQKISNSAIGNQRALGHTHSEETRKKISESLKKYQREKNTNV